MDMNEINEKQDGLLIFISIIGIVLFITLLDKALNEYKKKDRELSLAALFFAFLALAIAIGIASVIFRTTKKLVTTLKDINGLYARYCYVYEKMPEYAKRKGRVLNQHGVTVEAEEEFQAFMNSCFISCSLPREKRDPLKWDKKNIGKYFSL